MPVIKVYNLSHQRQERYTALQDDLKGLFDILRIPTTDQGRLSVQTKDHGPTDYGHYIMPKPIIEIENISKCYRIGAHKEPYLSLRDEIAKFASRLRPRTNRLRTKDSPIPISGP